MTPEGRPPTHRTGDMWDSAFDLYCIPSNAVITPKGLVMGAGVARQAVNRYGPTLARIAAQHINASADPTQYGFLPLNPEYPNLALLQTKVHFKDSSPLNLIRHSIHMLKAYANANQSIRIALPMPGVGHGHLSPAQVAPLLTELPDNVSVYLRD